MHGFLTATVTHRATDIHPEDIYLAELWTGDDFYGYLVPVRGHPCWESSLAARCGLVRGHTGDHLPTDPEMITRDGPWAIIRTDATAGIRPVPARQWPAPRRTPRSTGRDTA